MKEILEPCRSQIRKINQLTHDARLEEVCLLYPQWLADIIGM